MKERGRERERVNERANENERMTEIDNEKDKSYRLAKTHAPR